MVDFRSPNISIKGGIVRKGTTRVNPVITKWANKTLGRLELVQKLATYKLLQTMQRTVHEGGWLPFREGYLRASLIVSINSDAPKANRKKKNSTTTYNESILKEQIFDTSLGDRIRLSYTINYARTLEYTGVHAGFVMRSAQRWPSIFRAAVQEAKGMIK